MSQSLLRQYRRPAGIGLKILLGILTWVTRWILAALTIPQWTSQRQVHYLGALNGGLEGLEAGTTITPLSLQ